MTFPVHTAKHMGSSYRKFNIISVALMVITLIAALSAALSGIQLFKLQKKQAAQAPPVEAPVAIDDSLDKEIEAIKAELAKEKETSQKLKANISKLKKTKSALEKSIAAGKTPTPVAPPVEKTIPLPTPKETAAPAQTPAVKSNTSAPAAPEPATPIISDAPKSQAEPSATTPSNAPLPDPPMTEKPPAPIEKTEPPASQPAPDQPVLEQPQPKIKPDEIPESEAQTNLPAPGSAPSNEQDEASPSDAPDLDDSAAPVDQKPTAETPVLNEEKQVPEKVAPTETPAQKKP